jgi:hypothetical protein
MTPALFLDLERRVLADPDGSQHAAWAASLKPCTDPEQFGMEAVWCILCDGTSYKAARSMERLWNDKKKCNHTNKAAALRRWEAHYLEWWGIYQKCATDADRIAYIGTLPYMGPALRFQLAKNLGITSVCKPDVHLKRLAARYDMEPQALCEKLADETGHTVAYVDTILWFAAIRRWV